MCADPAPRVAHRLLAGSETAPVHVQIAWLEWPARVGSGRRDQVLRRQRSGRTSGWRSDEGSAFSPSRRELSPVLRGNQPPRARRSLRVSVSTVPCATASAQTAAAAETYRGRKQ